MAAARWGRLGIPLLLLRWSGLVLAAEQVAVVEVFLERPGVSALLRGEMVEMVGSSGSSEELQGDLVLVGDEETQLDEGNDEDELKEHEVWIGVVPVEMDDSKVSTSKQESFADAVVSKMKRALVLGASALIILVLNQNTVSEMDLSQVLSKPIVVVQTSENVTKLFGALLRANIWRHRWDRLARGPFPRFLWNPPAEHPKTTQVRREQRGGLQPAVDSLYPEVCTDH